MAELPDEFAGLRQAADAFKEMTESARRAADMIRIPWNLPMPAPPSLPDPIEYLGELKSDAEWMCETLTAQIIEFEKTLSPDQEIGARLVGAPDGSVFHVEDIGYSEPDLIRFHGRDMQDRPIELLQHVSQVNVALVALPVETEEPRRIGFILRQKFENENP